MVLAACGTSLGQERTIGLVRNDSGAYNGYTLFAPLQYNVTYLIDNQGMKVHSWPGTSRPGMSVYLTESGHLLRTALVDARPPWPSMSGGRIELVDWDGTVVWAFDYVDSTSCQHHDVCPMPNGNILMVAWDHRSQREAIDAGRNPATIMTDLLPDKVVEVDPRTDSIVWEWRLWDHLIQDFDSTKANFGVVRDHPELVDINWTGPWVTFDWTHTNSVTYNAEFDQVMISPRHFSEVWVIDHSTTTEQARGHAGGRCGRGGDLLYRWGNPAAYGRGTGQQQRLFCQHDAQWIADSLPGAGNILVFNNGVGRPGGNYSTVDEFSPPVDSLGFYRLGPDSTYGPDSAAWTWRIEDDLQSDHVSGCERFPNGNTFACAGPRGTFLEVTSDSTLVWKYINPVTSTGPQYQGYLMPPGENEVFKTRRYSPGFPGLAGRNLEPQGPIERYGPGVAQPDRSAVQPGLRLAAGPMPTRGRAFVDYELLVAGTIDLAVFDLLGNRVKTLACGRAAAGRHRAIWDASGMPSGAYFLALEAGADRQMRQFVITR